ncbi:MAG: DNA polymerase IV [Desulfuromonadales bacterium]|nr:DNA polymerase IV [Desulfuromonadales bacterium]
MLWKKEPIVALDSSRVILHVDMNAFFAAVEQQSNPALRGQPIAVTGSEKRSIILTASYEARAFGVKTGMTHYEALQCCPQLRLVSANNRLYTDISTRIMALLRDYTPLVEVSSVDEAFLDLTGSLRLFGSAERIGYLIKSRIKFRFGITCSVGIAPNKLLAKLASERRKPDGLTIFRAGEIPRLMESLPLQELCGIGRRLGAGLNRRGIFTCGQLQRYPLHLLRKQYGVVGDKLLAMAQGIGSGSVIPCEQSAPIKSVGHSRTLREDLSDREAITAFLLQLSDMVGLRARRGQVAGRVVTLTVRYADLSGFSRQQAQGDYLNQSADIYQAALKILDQLALEQPVRLLGVRLSQLRHAVVQLPLLPQERKQALLTIASDSVNNRHGDFTLIPGRLLEQKDKGSHVISPAWRPEGVRNLRVQ